MNGDYGISFDEEEGKIEKKADKFAQDILIDPGDYIEFVKRDRFSYHAIVEFAKYINRDPGIVLGRLQNDKKVGYSDRTLNSLRKKYKV